MSKKSKKLKKNLLNDVKQELKMELSRANDFEVKQELSNSNISLKDIKSVFHFKNSNDEISDLIYGVVQKIVNTVAMAPLNLYINDRKQINDLTVLLKSRINPFQTFTEFMIFMETQRNLKGNAFAYIVRGTSDSEIIGVYPLFSDDVSTFESPSDKSIWYQINGIDVPIHPTDMIHVKGLTLNSVTTNAKGTSPISTLSKIKDLDSAVINSTTKKLTNDFADFLITDVTKNKKAKELVYMMMADYYAEHGGLIYNDFGVDIQKLESNFSITDLDKSNNMVKTRIASVFGTPIQLTGAAYDYNGISETYQYFITSTITGILTQYSDQFTNKLLTHNLHLKGACFKFNTRSLLQSDFKTMQSYYQSAIRNGWMTINEVRIENGLDPIDGNADKPLISGDLYTLDTPPDERNSKKTTKKESDDNETLTGDDLT